MGETRREGYTQELFWSRCCLSIILEGGAFARTLCAGDQRELQQYLEVKVQGFMLREYIGPDDWKEK